MAKKKSAAGARNPARSQKRTSTSGKKSESPVADQLPQTTAEEEKAAKKRFAEALVARGQAVPKGQPLPPGATHEIVGYDDEGTPIVERRRFSLT
jgi:hypothetical protein